MKKQLLVAAAVAAIGVGGLGVSSAANALSSTTTTVAATKKVTLKKRLAQLVKNGKLTQAQANAIEAEHVVIVNERKANPLKKMTVVQRKATLAAERAEVKTWAEQNNIPAKYRHLALGIKR